MDTSTAATTAAVVGSGRRVVRTLVDPRAHVESLPSLIAQVLAEAEVSPGDIEAIACGVGPGPFTGLRVAVATATSMGNVLGVPVAGVCSHDAIAYATREGLGAKPVTVVTRARRAETFWSRFDAEGLREGGPLALPNDDIPRLPRDGVWAGDAVPVTVGADVELGPAHVDAGALGALVLQRREAGESWPQLQASGSDGDGDVELEDATQRGDSTQAWLLERARVGRVLLPPRPLYLRRPDAVAPASVSTR